MCVLTLCACTRVAPPLIKDTKCSITCLVYCLQSLGLSAFYLYTKSWIICIVICTQILGYSVLLLVYTQSKIICLLSVHKVYDNQHFICTKNPE